MAAAGGTGTARFANNQNDIEAALADITSSSVLYEICNGKDDNCNGLIDEGLGVYQECTQGGQCASGTCNAGRCTCNGNNQCNNGFICGGGFCLPSCSVGVGLCQRTGVIKCNGPNATGCCVNDGLPACTPLTPGQPMQCQCDALDHNCNGIPDNTEQGCCVMNCVPQPETCNGKDDDCDGKIDDNLIDINQPCGLNIGVCKPGTTECVNMGGGDVGKGAPPDNTDHLICAGGVQPQMIQCNGCDNNCDGVLDAPTQNCYDGPMGTNGVGPCHGGTQVCIANMCPQAAAYGPCVGEVLPQKEICNGIDDDCNGVVDDVMGANQPCCPSGKCGVGICTAGVMKCSGGMLACIGGQGPTPEICDGLDNDCNGKVDDVPGVGNPCVPMGGCPGTLQCDVQKMMLVCIGGMGGKEICNGVDDDCDGVIDEPAAVCKNDPKICDMNGNHLPCGNPNNLPLPCKAGQMQCVNGMPTCVGAVGPMPEVCDGIDNDCDGNTDNGAPCPPGFVCYMANCDPLCQQGEFPCPGGYTPVQVPQMMKCTVDGDCGPSGTCMNGMCQVCICAADKNCNPPCMNGLVCDTQSGTCVDPCAKINCPNGFMCSGGSCYGCEKFGCSQMCQRCDKASHMCVVDKCCNVNCDQGKFCDPNTGMCVSTCPNGCPAGQTCDNGNCVGDKCANKHCPERQTCDPMTGMCVNDPCTDVTCGPNLACCGGNCVADPCEATMCPNGLVCSTSTLTCQTSCNAPMGMTTPKDQIVGAGGGGFACSTSGSRPGDGAQAFSLILFALALTRLRRRR